MLPSTIANLDPNKVLASAKPLTKEDMPGLIPKKGAAADMERFNVRYQRLNMTNPADIIELERIETLALRNKGVFVISKTGYAFMDQYIYVIGYIEEEAV